MSWLTFYDGGTFKKGLVDKELDRRHRPLQRRLGISISM